jgi:hypothetical protein
MRGSPPTTHPKGRDFLAYALWYAQLGFRVIPLRERDKRPLIDDWPNKATTDEATIRGWGAKWPKANIGILTGRYRDGYFCVLDFDPRNGGDWYADAPKSDLPDTWVVHPGGGGRHYYYKTPSPLRGRKLKDGVDLKGEGGYVVAPPSIHPKGEPYVWEVGAGPGDMPIGEVPEWVLREAAGEGAPENGAGERRPSLWRMHPPIPKGMRHDYLVSLAGALWGAGVRESEVEAVLWGVLELFETIEDFDPKPEIGGIIKGLKGWEGEGLDLAIVLRSLPEAVWAIVRREVAAAADLVAKENGVGRVEGTGKGKGAAEGGEKAKKREKKKGAAYDEALAALMGYEWVEWLGGTWAVEGRRLIPATLERVHGLLKRHGVEIGKEALNSHLADLLDALPTKMLDGIVVSEAPKYGKAGGIRGLWMRRGTDLYVVTADGIRRFSFGEWPKGVYTLSYKQRDYWPDWRGEPEDLFAYWEGVANRLAGDKWVALAMFLPALLDQGHFGLILRGPAGTGKSTLQKAMGYLRLGRPPKTPQGATMRDFLTVLNQKAIVFFDEVGHMSEEMQTALKSMITGNGLTMRALYTDNEEVENEMLGTAVFCTPKLERLQSDLRTRCFVWELENKGGGDFEGDILDFCRLLWRRALAGAIKLYQQAAKLPPPPKNLLPELRFRDWLAWAYRYAQVLGVADKFVAYVRKSKIAAHKGEKFEFLIDALSNPNFDPKKEYTITELKELADPGGTNLRGVENAVSTEGARDAIITLANSMGYLLRIERKRAKGENKPKLRFIFTPMQVDGSDRLRELLRSRGIDPDWEGGWDGDVALPAVPLPQNGHAPVPEVHPPTPAPEPVPIAAKGAPMAPIPLPASLSEVKQAVRKAPPVPEPVPAAAQSAPAEGGGGDPIAPPAPEKPVAIAVQSAPLFLTPEEKESHERALAGLREELARLPKPGGLLRQRGTPIEGWGHASAPPELNEYLRAMAGALAAEAARAAEKGRLGEAGGLWASAGEYLTHLTAFEPTREAIAAGFLARAADRALVAAKSATQMGEAAALLAKGAELVFFGKAAPDVLLGVLLEAPYPTEYDPCLAGHYRYAAGYLVAAHWVLTGGDPKRLTEWVWPGRWKRDDAEAMLYFSLGSEKKAVACAHLYLGDLPF